MFSDSAGRCQGDWYGSQLLQIIADLGSVLIAQLPIFLQCLGDDLVEFYRQLGIPAGYGFRRFVQYGRKGRADGLTVKRQVPRGHFVNYDTKGEQVGSRVQFLALHLLGRHEGDSARGIAQSW